MYKITCTIVAMLILFVLAMPTITKNYRRWVIADVMNSYANCRIFNGEERFCIEQTRDWYYTYWDHYFDW